MSKRNWIVWGIISCWTAIVYGQENVLTAAASAPTTDALFQDYHFIKQQDAWLMSTNAAALTRFQHSNIAQAELSATHQDGELINYDGSPRVWQSHAGIESLFRIHPRVVLFGAMNYHSFDGKDMGGSAFLPQQLWKQSSVFPSAIPSHLSSIVPSGSHRPFDIVEDSTNQGEKHADIYQLTGGIGWQFYQRTAAGLRLDYTAANYAKYKDLRHKNKLMDLLLTAGVYTPITSWLSAGAHYQYHRNIESVSFATYGKSDKVYRSLIDYGNFFGLSEQFGSVGYTDKNREMPLFEEGHGGGLQLELAPLRNWTIFASMQLSSADGYYGRKSPYTVTFTQHQRDGFETSARLKYARPTSQHYIDMAFTKEQLDNEANTYSEQKNEAGATYYEYYDPVETGKKEWQQLHLAYTAHLGIKEQLPTWTITTAFQWEQRKQTSYLYPYYRQQKLNCYGWGAALARNLAIGKGICTLSAEAAFRKGTDSKTDGSFVTDNQSKQQPSTLIDRESPYYTTQQYLLGSAIQYAFLLPNTHVKAHIRLSVSYQKAEQTLIYNNGCDRKEAVAAIGCTF